MIDNLNIPLLSVLIFHGIVFCQSGLDKIFNWKGNFDFTKETLTDKFPSTIVNLALFIVLILEILGGIFSVIGVFYIFIDSSCLLFSQIGLSLCSLALLILMLGQRVSQNYADAKSIAIYFIISIIGMTLVF
jgi:uncharacterized membrane protein YphA (DoxX/SURF4 family)